MELFGTELEDCRCAASRIPAWKQQLILIKHKRPPLTPEPCERNRSGVELGAVLVSAITLPLVQQQLRTTSRTFKASSAPCSFD